MVITSSEINMRSMAPIVLGFIAATRNNGMGMDGIADDVLIMPVRATIPDTSSGYLFRYPPCNCGSGENIPSEVEQTIPAMTLEGKTYTQVVAAINVVATNQQSSPYRARGVGLIKPVMLTPAGTSTHTLVKFINRGGYI